jgi:hypothetical protein
VEVKELIKQNLRQDNRVFFETTFVLFFLSLDLGQNLFAFGFDVAFLGFTVLAIAVLPYFLPSADEVGLAAWMTGRGAIALLGVLGGLAFNQLLGGVLPEALSILPLVFATIAGGAACIAMFAGFFKVSYAE